MLGGYCGGCQTEIAVVRFRSVGNYQKGNAIIWHLRPPRSVKAHRIRNLRNPTGTKIRVAVFGKSDEIETGTRPHGQNSVASPRKGETGAESLKPSAVYTRVIRIRFVDGDQLFVTLLFPALMIFTPFIPTAAGLGQIASQACRANLP